MRPYYQDSSCVIYHGDCREVREWLSCGVLLSDPPYGIAWKKGLNRAAGSRAHAGIVGDSSVAARDEMLALWGGKPALVFGSFYAPFPADVGQILVWQKPVDAGVVGSVTGYRRDVEPIFMLGEWPKRNSAWSSVVRSTIGGIAAMAARTGHPHTKPVDLLRLLLARSPDGSVADPFMGSGSTLVAAKEVGRRAVGIEVEEKFCEIAAQRLSQEVLDLGA